VIDELVLASNAAVVAAVACTLAAESSSGFSQCGGTEPGGSMRSVMTVYGTRPEAIKMAPLIAALLASSSLRPIIAMTGQHREMLDQVNALFDIVPDFDMDLMTPGASLTQITTRVLAATSDLLGRVLPDVVVVQGDTSSAFAAALAAFYHRIPVVHLEAGRRTGNIYSPFPEEANRRLTAPISALHLAPTSTSRAKCAHAAAAERISSTRAGTSPTPRVCSATTAVRLERRAAANDSRWGQRANTATAVGNEPPKADHRSGRLSELDRANGSGGVDVGRP
jgi:hypothetical protein